MGRVIQKDSGASQSFALPPGAYFGGESHQKEFRMGKSIRIPWQGPFASSLGIGWHNYMEIADAYASKGGMGDGELFASLAPSGEKHKSDTISDALRRRLASDPLRNLQQRESMPRPDYERLMMYVDTVAEEAGRGGGESDGELSRYVRVCTLAKIPIRSSTKHSHISAS